MCATEHMHNIYSIANRNSAQQNNACARGQQHGPARTTQRQTRRHETAAESVKIAACRVLTRHANSVCLFAIGWGSPARSQRRGIAGWGDLREATDGATFRAAQMRSAAELLSCARARAFDAFICAMLLRDNLFNQYCIYSLHTHLYICSLVRKRACKSNSSASAQRSQSKVRYVPSGYRNIVYTVFRMQSAQIPAA